MTTILHYLPLAASDDYANFFADPAYIGPNGGWSLVAQRTVEAKRRIEAAGGFLRGAVAKYPWLQAVERCDRIDPGAISTDGGYVHAVPYFGMKGIVRDVAGQRIFNRNNPNEQSLIQLFDQTRARYCDRILERHGLSLSIYTGGVNEENMPTDADIDAFAGFLAVCRVEGLVVDASCHEDNETAVYRLRHRLSRSVDTRFIGEAAPEIGGMFDTPDSTCFMTDQAYRTIGGLDGLRARQCKHIVAYEGTTAEAWDSFLEAARSGLCESVVVNVLVPQSDTAIAELVEAVAEGNVNGGGR